MEDNLPKGDREIARIDCHVHIFEILKGFCGKGEMRPIGGGWARWANGEVVRMVPPELGDDSFPAETCNRLLRQNHVEKAVLLQGSFYGFQNEYVAEAVRRYPDMFIGAVALDPFGESADPIYERITREPGMRAIKFETSSDVGLMSYHRAFEIDEVMDKFAAKALNHGQTLVLDVGRVGMPSYQPESVRKLAVKYPALRIVVCHLLAPAQKDGDVLKKSLALLSRPNIYFDISALPFNVRPDTYPYPTAVSYIKTACDIVGYHKLLWGTDTPSVLCHDSYAHLADYLSRTGEFTDDQLRAIYSENAMRAYDF